MEAKVYWGGANYIELGKVGVALMFLITGYLMYDSMERKNLADFLRGRCIRLYPTYWFSMILAIALIGGFQLTQIAANATMLQMFIGQKDMIGLYCIVLDDAD